MTSPSDELIFAHFIFAFVHFAWFVIYYSRYSTFNQKLAGIAKMDKAGVVAPEVLERSSVSLQNKITTLKKKCLVPVPVVAAAHAIYLYSLKLATGADYLNVLYILVGSVILILLANVAKGRQIIDPYKRFRDTTS